MKKNILAVAKRNKMHLNEYTLDTIKHLILMQNGKITGFQVTDGTEDSLPERMIQEAYVDDYRLKNYLPVIMHSAIWSGNNIKDTLYYSINLPIIVSGIIPEMKNLRRTELLRQIKNVLKDVDGSKDFSYRYMHHAADRCKYIQRPEDVFSDDSRILPLQQRYPDRLLPSTSTFVTGCIQVRRVKQESSVDQEQQTSNQTEDQVV